MTAKCAVHAAMLYGVICAAVWYVVLWSCVVEVVGAVKCVVWCGVVLVWCSVV